MKNQSNILEELLTALSKNKHYVISGKLNKTVLVDYAFKMNEGLLAL